MGKFWILWLNVPLAAGKGTTRRIVTHCFLRLRNILTYLLTYLKNISTGDIFKAVVKEEKFAKSERNKRLCVSDKAFSIAEPRAWNALPVDIKPTDLRITFREKVKIPLFMLILCWFKIMLIKLYIFIAL